ncbi:hypothetical protein PIB30_062861 [Stylosanthes scabra]|uniref:Uncharacterized protein n=1 Tax=Stylosanthes scabra TaxID=79078 RepID=A0ABU6QM24_9FABA|nr:hypothetical protein [Stylosanthes scabra]
MLSAHPCWHRGKFLTDSKEFVQQLSEDWIADSNAIPAPFLRIECTARNGAPAPCPSCARALDVNFVIKKAAPLGARGRAVTADFHMDYYTSLRSSGC